MKSMIKWLIANNLKFRPVTMTNGKNGIMIDTNYNGEHPKAETYHTHSMIEKKASRLKLNGEPRGHWTAYLITE